MGKKSVIGGIVAVIVSVPAALRFWNTVLAYYTAPSDTRDLGGSVMETLKAVGHWPAWLTISMMIGIWVAYAVYLFGDDGLVKAWRFVFRREAREADLRRLGDKRRDIQLDLEQQRDAETQKIGLGKIAAYNLASLIMQDKEFWTDPPPVFNPLSKEQINRQLEGRSEADIAAAHRHFSRSYPVQFDDRSQAVVSQLVKRFGYRQLEERFKALQGAWKMSQQLIHLESDLYFPNEGIRLLWRSANRDRDSLIQLQRELRAACLAATKDPYGLANAVEYLPQLPAEEVDPRVAV